MSETESQDRDRESLYYNPEGTYQTAYAIKGESRVEYYPVETVITEYEEVRRQVQLPITKKVTDYYAIQHDVEYIPQKIMEKVVEYRPIERYHERVEYQQVVKQTVLQQVSQTEAQHPTKTPLTQPLLTNIPIYVQPGYYPGHPDFTYYFDSPPKNNRPDPRVPITIPTQTSPKKQ